MYWPYYEFETLVYWQSRNRFNKVYRFPDVSVFDKKSGATLGETEGSKGDFLYGFDDCDIASYVTITESIFGQYTLGQQALASGGASLTPSQVGKIKILGPKKGIILSPDNDSAGVKSMIHNFRLLQPLGYPIYWSLPPKLEYQSGDKKKYTKDWNELVQELKMSRHDVRQIHDKLLKKMTIPGLAQVYSLLSKKS